jgi:uncharacterized Zn-binding protein involved in type VI secretion
MSKTIALVGDKVGFDGFIMDGDNTITFMDVPLAIVGSNVSVHKGPSHPSTPKPAVLTVGSEFMSAGPKQIVVLPTLADCGCSVEATVLPQERSKLTGA